MSNEDWRELANRIDRLIARIRARQAKTQKEKGDERLKKDAELGADTHQRIRNLLRIVQSRHKPQTQNS